MRLIPPMKCFWTVSSGGRRVLRMKFGEPQLDGVCQCIGFKIWLTALPFFFPCIYHEWPRIIVTFRGPVRECISGSPHYALHLSLKSGECKSDMARVLIIM